MIQKVLIVYTLAVCALALKLLSKRIKRFKVPVPVKPVNRMNKEDKTIYKNLRMKIIVRTDLHMGRGKIGSQCAHAAVSAVLNQINLYKNRITQWEFNGQPKIVLRVGSEAELNHIYKSAIANGINASRIHDAGRTQIESGSLTCVALGPDEDELINKITGDLKLL